MKGVAAAKVTCPEASIISPEYLKYLSSTSKTSRLCKVFEIFDT